ncbi:MAG: DNA recombination protein RmuC [Rickettsiaceae bacterium]|nr:DNA recombination protein RmuC [Rickettsiaceae bacterium]
MQERNSNLEQQNTSLNTDNINNLIQIEKLSTQLEILKLEIASLDKIKSESLALSQQNFQDSSKNLTQQLLEMHKQETKSNLNITEQSITSIVNKVKGDFEKITTAITLLTKDIEQSKTTNETIKKALLSPTSTGQLAEITLVNILSSSGLRQNTDFFVQNTFAGDDKMKFRPDVIFTLPDHVLIIDAKSSKFFMELELGENEEKNSQIRDSFVKSLSTHLRSLASKDYRQAIIDSEQFSSEQKSNITTIMFLPSESFIEKLMQLDGEFLNKAWQLNIFPVGPSGLMNLLLLAKKQIAEKNKAINYQEILLEIQKLIESVEVVFEHSSRLGTHIQSLTGAYDKFAASFNRNFLSKTQKLKKMGITTKKQHNISLKRYTMISNNDETIIESEFEE